MKYSIVVLFLVTWTLPVMGQVGSQAGQIIIGSATLIRKAAAGRYDRWEISFHDISRQNQVLWLLAKSEKNLPLNASSYRIRKKTFDKMGLKDMLGVTIFDDKQLPVNKGEIMLKIRDSRLVLEATLKIKGIGIKNYTYSGNYKTIEARL